MNYHDDVHEDPPPSYQEATGAPSSTHRSDQGPPLPPRQHSKQPGLPTPPTTPGESSSTHRSPPPSTYRPPPPQHFSQLLPAVTRQFLPPTINLYRDAFPGAPSIQRRLFLGEHQHPALYAVALLPGALVLHGGPSDDFPPLASVAFTTDPPRASGRAAMHISLPHPHQHSPPQPIAATRTPRGGALAFSVEVPWGGGGGVRREAFEWRRSSSVAVGPLGGAAPGWKLVRLQNELPPGLLPGAAAGGSVGPPSGDGHEVVAVCTSAVMSMTKLWKFCFLGTGVSGALGERWAVMAVVTGLVTWDRENRL